MTELPEGWELRRLSDCLEKLKSGKKAERGWSPQCLSHPSVDENVWGVLKTTSVQMGEFQPEYNKELPNSLAPKSGLEVNSGDFLVTTTGPRNRCGIVCHVKKTRKRLIFSGKILRFRVNESLILPNWLMYLLMSPEYQNILDKMKVGTSDSSVSIGNQQILDLQIPVPPLPEQQKIVEILEDHLSRLDAALADVKQAKLKAAQFRRSLLQAAFTGNLSGDGTSLMTELSPSWKVSKIGDVADVIRGVTYSKADILSENDKNSVPLLRATNLEVDAIDFNEMVYVPKKVVKEQQFLRIDDILLAASSGSISVVGKSAQVVKTNGATFGAFCSVIRPKSIHAKFLALWVQSPEIRDHWSATAKGTNINNLKTSDILETRVPLPPLSEQQKIVNILESYLSHLDVSVAMADEMERLSSSLRRSLLQASFTGQLTKEVASV